MELIPLFFVTACYIGYFRLFRHKMKPRRILVIDHSIVATLFFTGALFSGFAMDPSILAAAVLGLVLTAGSYFYHRGKPYAHPKQPIIFVLFVAGGVVWGLLKIVMS